ncbi:Wzz/FepE/Etk N-terminal domain-containing protein [Seramator thermalis]|uniref:Wzz/FepE/Etk N-terminal domain-containing protein n=1 Tax=Seramator thermalis TaxID=2496270 RepID=UPI00101B73E8|nr:Wzz/FepE/Etk N-terminal domain-containing protein [Seramator thermalis]
MDTTPQASQNLGNTIPPTRQQPAESDEIDLKDLFIKIWTQRKLILVVTAIAIVIGLLVAFLSPVEYSASCTVVPQQTEKSGSNLAGIASMMGVNLGSGMSGETLSPTVYPNIVKSAPYCSDIMQTKITTKKSSVPITLYEYYTKDEYRDKNPFSIIAKYTIGLPGTILSAITSNDSEDLGQAIYSDTITGKVISLSEDERKVYEIIRNNIQLELNSKDGYIVLGYSFGEPEAVAQITQNLYTTLDKYVRNYKAQKAEDNLIFVQSSYEDARADFLRKQSELAAFQDANRDLSTASARAILRRLNSEYDIAFTVYNELAKQLEQAKLAVKQSIPVLTVIDPVVVPNQKSAPRRAMILIVFTFLGVIIGIGWVFIKPFIDDLRSSVRTVHPSLSEQPIFKEEND